MKSKITLQVLLMWLLFSVATVGLLVLFATMGSSQTPKPTPTPKPRPALKQQTRRQPNPETAVLFWLKTGLDDSAQNLVEAKFYDAAQTVFGWNIIFIRNEQELQSYPGRSVNVLDFQTTMDGVGAERLDSTGLAVGRVIWDTVYRQGRQRLPGTIGETTDVIVGDGRQEAGTYGNHFRRYYRTNVTVLAPPAAPVRLTFYWGVKYAYKSRQDVTCAKIDRFDHNFATVQKAGMDNEVDLGCIVQDAVSMGVRRETFSQSLQEAWVGRWLTQVKAQTEKQKVEAQQQQELAKVETARPRPRQAPVQTNPGCKGDPVCEALGATPVASQPAPPAPKPTPTPTPVPAAPANAPTAEAPPNFGHTKFEEIFYDPTSGMVQMTGPRVEKALAFLVNNENLAWNPAWRGISWGKNATAAWREVEDALKAAGLKGVVQDGRIGQVEWNWLNTQRAEMFNLTPAMLQSKAKAAAVPAPVKK